MPLHRRDNYLFRKAQQIRIKSSCQRRRVFSQVCKLCQKPLIFSDFASGFFCQLTNTLFYYRLSLVFGQRYSKLPPGHRSSLQLVGAQSCPRTEIYGLPVNLLPFMPFISISIMVSADERKQPPDGPCKSKTAVSHLMARSKLSPVTKRAKTSFNALFCPHDPAPLKLHIQTSLSLFSNYEIRYIHFPGPREKPPSQPASVHRPR